MNNHRTSLYITAFALIAIGATGYIPGSSLDEPLTYIIVALTFGGVIGSELHGLEAALS